METSKENRTDSLSEFILIITFLSFVFGIANLTIYYGKFSFNIFEYLDLTEIVANSIRDSIYIAIPLILMTYVHMTRLKSTIGKNGPDTLPITKKKNNWSIYVFLLMVILSPVIDLIRHRPFVYERVILYMSLFYFLLLLGIIEFEKFLKSNFGYQIAPKMMLVLFLSILLLFGSTILSSFKISSIVPKNDIGNTYIIIKGDTIKSTTKVYYIGRSRNYIFFYNVSTKSTEVYPNKDISKVSLR